MNRISPYVGKLATAHAFEVAGHRPNSQLDKQLMNKIIVASMPLIGIVLGIVSVAAWTAI